MKIKLRKLEEHEVNFVCNVVPIDVSTSPDKFTGHFWCVIEVLARHRGHAASIKLGPVSVPNKDSYPAHGAVVHTAVDSWKGREQALKALNEKLQQLADVLQPLMQLEDKAQ